MWKVSSLLKAAEIAYNYLHHTAEPTSSEPEAMYFYPDCVQLHPIPFT